MHIPTNEPAPECALVKPLVPSYQIFRTKKIAEYLKAWYNTGSLMYLRSAKILMDTLYNEIISKGDTQDEQT